MTLQTMADELEAERADALARHIQTLRLDAAQPVIARARIAINAEVENLHENPAFAAWVALTDLGAAVGIRERWESAVLRPGLALFRRLVRVSK